MGGKQALLAAEASCIPHSLFFRRLILMPLLAQLNTSITTQHHEKYNTNASGGLFTYDQFHQGPSIRESFHWTPVISRYRVVPLSEAALLKNGRS